MDNITTGPTIGVSTQSVTAHINLPPMPGLSGAPDLAGLEPMAPLTRRWPSYLGAAVTVVMIVWLGLKLRALGVDSLVSALPTNPLFYIFFGLLYISPVTGDFIIFRKLWGIPAAGFVALTKKRIANDVLNYSGEAYFYAWARQRSSMVAAPFGAVKDVSILSAIAGNMVTLAMIAVAMPLGIGLLTEQQLHNAIWSVVAVFAMSLPFLIFSKRVFSLPRATLWWIFGIHCLRLIAGSVLIAFAWHYGLPSVSLGMWLLLSAARLIVGRLPLVPNKDLLFATFATLLIGQDAALSVLIAVTAALPLLVHVVLIAIFGLVDLVRKN
ncbi:MAG: hypothetical protein WCS75_06155 [Sphingomonas sp.]|uniref:hypothetical protein n=1 Tax=Sphingomonas sp. TaxID=28214 RepID=UPI00356B0FA8